MTGLAAIVGPRLPASWKTATEAAAERQRGEETRFTTPKPGEEAEFLE